MSTAFEQAWADQEERPTETLGMSQDDLIAEFIKVVDLAKEYGARRRDLGAALTAIALENKGAQSTVRLESTSGQRLKIEFGFDYEFDAAQMFTAADLLGKDRFDDLFKTEITFTAKKRNLNAFLNTVPSDETTRTAKQIIQDAMHKKEKTPYVSIA